MMLHVNTVAGKDLAWVLWILIWGRERHSNGGAFFSWKNKLLQLLVFPRGLHITQYFKNIHLWLTKRHDVMLTNDCRRQVTASLLSQHNCLNLSFCISGRRNFYFWGWNLQSLVFSFFQLRQRSTIHIPTRCWTSYQGMGPRTPWHVCWYVKLTLFDFSAL